MKLEQMDEHDMDQLLLGLADPQILLAIETYLNKRDNLITTAIRTMDPFKDPTGIARHQGISTGLYDLRDYILLLKKRAQEEEANIETRTKEQGK